MGHYLGGNVSSVVLNGPKVERVRQQKQLHGEQVLPSGLPADSLYLHLPYHGIDERGENGVLLHLHFSRIFITISFACSRAKQ